MRAQLESQALLSLLEDEVVPSFYGRGVDGNPAGWLSRVRSSIQVLGPQVAAARMVRDYVDELYVPAARRADPLLHDAGGRARTLAAWKRRVLAAWPEVRVGSVHLERRSPREQRVEAWVSLGGLDADDVEVQILVGRVDAADEVVDATAAVMRHEGHGDDGSLRHVGEVSVDQTGTFGLAVRVVPRHTDLASWAELGRVHVAPPEARRS